MRTFNVRLGNSAICVGNLQKNGKLEFMVRWRISPTTNQPPCPFPKRQNSINLPEWVILTAIFWVHGFVYTAWATWTRMVSMCQAHIYLCIANVFVKAFVSLVYIPWKLCESGSLKVITVMCFRCFSTRPTHPLSRRKVNKCAKHRRRVPADAYRYR